MNSQNKFMHAYILKENKNKSKKNHTFINTFSKRKSPKFYKCIFSQKKTFKHTSYMHSKRNHTFIKAFFLEKIFQTCTIYESKKNHVFKSAFSEKIHVLIQTYIIYAFSKNKKSKISLMRLKK